MKGTRHLLVVTALACVVYGLWPRPVCAYLDPGTGSYLIQMLIAAVVGVGFAVKLYWSRIKGWFNRGEPEEAEVSEDD